MGNIMITLKTEESKTKLVQRLNENNKLRELAEVKVLEEEKKKIITFNVPSCLTDQEVVGKAKNQLNLDSENEIDIDINRFPEKNGYTHVVLQLPKKLAEKIIEQGRLLIGLRSCGLKDYKEVVRCRGCKGYGHTSTTCRLQRYCGYCAEPTHDSAACPHKENLAKVQCVACMRGKIPTYKHSAFSRMCLHQGEAKTSWKNTTSTRCKSTDTSTDEPEKSAPKNNKQKR